MNAVRSIDLVWQVELAQIIRDRQGKAYLPGENVDLVLDVSYWTARTEYCRYFADLLLFVGED
jgi:hypothetical protein